MHAATAVGMARFAATSIYLLLACIAVYGGVLAQVSSNDIDDLTGRASGSGDSEDGTSDTEGGDVEDVIETDQKLKVQWVNDTEFEICSRYPEGKSVVIATVPCSICIIRVCNGS